MGVAKQRRLQFIADHPRCCYCANATETEDHNPPRCFFPGGGAPQGFVVPSCSACNAKKKDDESICAFVLNTFNLNEPNDEHHAALTSKRMLAFFDRMPELKRMVLEQVPSEPASNDRVPFQLPMGIKLALVRTGVALFRALHYRQTGEICSADHNVLIRYSTNVTIQEEGQAIGEFVAPLNRETPASADPRVKPRFGWGWRRYGDRMEFAAEIAASTLWFCFIQKESPPAEVVDYFDWFGGDGRLIRLNE